MTIRKLKVAILLVSVVITAQAMGQQGSNNGQPFKALALDIATNAEDIATNAGDIATVVNTLADNSLVVTISADTEACASVPVQCSNFTYEAAADDNNNPFRIFVHVTRKGAAVTSLTESDFNFNNPFVPAGGGAAGICDDVDCGSSNFAGSGGVYSMWLKRLPVGNWKAGAYGGSMTVNDDSGNSGSTLVTFNIPEAI